MVIVPLVVVFTVFLLLVGRRRRKSTLAGLNGARPVFSVSPPTRRVGPPGRF